MRTRPTSVARRLAAVVLLAGVLGSAGTAQAGILGIPTGEGGIFEKILDVRCYPWYNPGQHDFDRAGHPDCIHKFARCSYNRRYAGYQVGGGAALYGPYPTALRGEQRYMHEGTFGVDYDPPWSRVRLQWFHGRRYQDGQGQYEPDDHNNPFSKFFSGR